MSANEPQIEWKDAGRYTICAIVDGRIYAVLYWSDGFAGYRPGEDQEGAPSDLGSGWFLVFADDPDLHLRLEGSTLQPVVEGMSDDELAAAAQTAAAPARAWILKRLGGPG